MSTKASVAWNCLGVSGSTQEALDAVTSSSSRFEVSEHIVELYLWFLKFYFQSFRSRQTKRNFNLVDFLQSAATPRSIWRLTAILGSFDEQSQLFQVLSNPCWGPRLTKVGCVSSNFCLHPRRLIFLRSIWLTYVVFQSFGRRWGGGVLSLAMQRFVLRVKMFAKSKSVIPVPKCVPRAWILEWSHRQARWTHFNPLSVPSPTIVRKESVVSSHLLPVSS